MKKKDIIYGSLILGLGVLLYFKFGKKKSDNSGSSSGGASSGSPSGTTTGSTSGTKTNTKSTVSQNNDGKCGDFTLYYGTTKHEVSWNNGSPQVTKIPQLQYPSAPSGSIYRKPNPLFDATTSPLSVHEYTQMCNDKQTGNFDSAPYMGGVRPDVVANNPVTIINIPDVSNQPVKTKTFTVSLDDGLSALDNKMLNFSEGVEVDLMSKVIN